ncbi:alpha/beta fold hydrolase [Streptomyces sp. NPDC049881]|uniref:alpha/beta hydrolase n=1 Tax=unclassified Streptomyces TaxID=2593676 RepID=UPI00341E2292
MTTPRPLSRGVRPVTLDGDGITLSALLREPDDGPRATVVALHGAGMCARYFDGQAHPDLSLLALGARLGFTVLAVDRPGYGRSAAALPDGRPLADQARVLRAALGDFAARYATGAGLFLLGHSFGGKVALVAAADHAPPSLLGVDVSGCGHRYAGPAEDVSALAALLGRAGRRRNWGPLALYPPGTFLGGDAVVAATPARERTAAARWPEVYAGLAPRVRVPVRFTFAEHEAWWRHGAADVADLRARLTAAPRVVVDRQPGAGHNISMGWAARAYHLRALAFFEECLAPHRADRRERAGLP